MEMYKRIQRKARGKPKIIEWYDLDWLIDRFIAGLIDGKVWQTRQLKKKQKQQQINQNVRNKLRNRESKKRKKENKFDEQKQNKKK